MTTDKGLVERLENARVAGPFGDLLDEAAARIRELEAKVEKLNDAGMKMLCEISKQARGLGRLEAFRDAAEARCRKLEDALRAAQRALATVISPNAIQSTSTSHAWAQCVAAETKARALLDQADGEEGNG